jgi:hypothetical protein
MERCLKLCKGIFLALAWIIAQSLSAQTITVSGNVSDVSGEPLIGVTIQVANSSVGTGLFQKDSSFFNFLCCYFLIVVIN